VYHYYILRKEKGLAPEQHPHSHQTISFLLHPSHKDMILSKPDRLLSWRKGVDALHYIYVFHGEKIGLA
jgi:hypothetical protein